MNETVKQTIQALERNRMKALYCDTKEQVWGLVRSLIADGATIASGGSVSLEQCGVTAGIKEGNYRYLDRNRPDLTGEERAAVLRQAFGCDTYLMSSNAVTQTGELVNVDGNGNRVAALIYGPKQVIVVAGVNKIVPDVQAGIRRIRQIAAPLNCRRLHKHTYCAETGHCVALDTPDTAIGQGCSGERICSSYVVSAYQMNPGRITVILCGEELGY